MHKLIWLIPLCPLLAAIVNGLLGRRLRWTEKTIAGIAVGSIALAFLISLAAIFSYGYAREVVWPRTYVTTQFAYTWIVGGTIELTQDAVHEARRSNDRAPLEIKWSYQLDSLSAIFMLIVTGVGLCIFIFAAGYMHGDVGFARFYAALSLFIFFMLILVMGANFMMMFVGWEGVGLCSYLLIGYYYDRDEANDAARKAFLVNRIGDAGFILAICAVIAVFGSTEFTTVTTRAASFPLETFGHWGIMSWIALGLFIGAVGKSAQIPLYVWLPDAMAGPTPVSALIHAATMVTAGVYMLTRTNIIFQHSRTMMFIVATIGAATAIFAATIAVTQTDIKKVLAYSTISQLGLMFLACGVGAFAIGVFHVMTHAFFKCLLFLCAGSVIHAMHHEQDIRRMGGLRRYLPKTYLTFTVGWLAICGVIPLSGFWSKDEILWSAAGVSIIPGSLVLWLIGLTTAGLTAFYMTRLMALVFWGRERFLAHAAGGQADEAHAHGYDEGITRHDARLESVGDRPFHEPGEHVGAAHPQHGHGFELPRETPSVMWMPLIILALLAVTGGFVGISPAFARLTGSEHPGGRGNIITWLEPVIWHAENVPEANGENPRTANDANKAQYQNLAHAAEDVLGSHTSAELLAMAFSLLAAGTGIGLGWLCYIIRPQLPQRAAQRLKFLYRASLHKFWVDELYGALFTRRAMDASRVVYNFDVHAVDNLVRGAAGGAKLLSRMTHAFDEYVVDNIVVTFAVLVRRLVSPLLRQTQTGLLQNYALVMILGLIIALALFFGGEIIRTMRELLALNLLAMW